MELRDARRRFDNSATSDITLDDIAEKHENRTAAQSQSLTSENDKIDFSLFSKNSEESVYTRASATTLT